jgi:2-polyprenyl-3-methyl-5-hydroxy-6-metoxy-1,4-benzoquinol methylase
MVVMDKTVVQKLFDINGQFYQEYGGAFAETRRRIQPGVRCILTEWIHDGNWLDLGCGSGALSAKWVEQNLTGLYEGLDFSSVLIETASLASQSYDCKPGQQLKFNIANLADPEWPRCCSLPGYDGLLMFAALHHIPGAETRSRLLNQISALLPAGGLFIHSEWQFDRSPKLSGRIQPWSAVCLSDTDVDAGDALLDWRHVLPNQSEQPGLRYVHLFSHEELAYMAEANGFTIEAEFDSDGVTGNLSLYQVWRKG